MLDPLGVDAFFGHTQDTIGLDREQGGLAQT